MKDEELELLQRLWDCFVDTLSGIANATEDVEASTDFYFDSLYTLSEDTEEMKALRRDLIEAGVKLI